MADLDIELESQAQVILEVEGDLRFPANVVGGNGIAVTRDGVDYVITNVEGPLQGPVGPQGDTGATGATGAAGPITAGAVVNSAYAAYTANADLTAIIPADDTIPQVTEGTQIASVGLTPSSATNKVRVRVHLIGSVSTTPGSLAAAVFLNGAANAIAGAMISSETANYLKPLSFQFEHVPGATTLQTYTLRVGPTAAGTVRLNGTTTARLLGGVMATTITVEEIKV